MSEPGEFIARMAASPFVAQEPEIRRYWRSEKPFDSLNDGFDRLSALAMLAEIERLRRFTASGTHLSPSNKGIEMSDQKVTWHLYPEGTIITADEGDLFGIVCDSTVNSHSDYMLYVDRSVRREYEHGELVYEAERRKHGLTRVWVVGKNGGKIRYYWYRLRVPWIAWAMFS